MGGVGVPHGRGGDHAALEDQARLDPEEGRTPQHQIRQLADLHRADDMGDAVGDGRVDGVLGQIALDPGVVRPPVAGESAALDLHLVGRLPGSQDDLAHAAHGLGVRGDHGEGPEVVEDVLGGDGLPADAGLREGYVLGDGGVQVMAHHEHVQMLVDRVDRVRPGRIGGAGQDVGLPAALMMSGGWPPPAPSV